jgi:S1/P1 Nuclease
MGVTSRSLITAVACFWCAAPALAWDNFGHMEVAAVAWELMSAPAKAEATSLLKRNPQYQHWTANVPAEKRDKYAFMLAATWPDFIKREGDYQDDGDEGGDVPPPDSRATQNDGYSDHLRHKYWHFIDTPIPSTARAALSPNVKTQIGTFRAVLPKSSGANDDLRSYDLVWLLHLVGDAHQPLHAANHFAADLPPAGDAGGNKVEIHCESGTSCLGARELHAFWDDLLGPNSTTPEKVETAADQLAKADAALASIGNEANWLDESYNLAKSDVYKSPVVGDTNATITSAYEANAKEIAKKRIALAGARLANLLDTNFR